MEKTIPLPILHLITRLIIGGAQENTMLTADYLDKSRWKVDVISGPQTGSEGSLIEAVRQRGVSLTIEPALVREINPLNDVLALLRLWRSIKRGRYAIVHSHSSKAGILGRWAAKLAGAPIIVHTVHGWGHTDRQHPLVRQLYIGLEKLTLPITDCLITVSPRDIEKGLRDGIGRPEDYVVIRSGIELDQFGFPAVPREQTRVALNLPASAPVVGTVARLSAQKAPLDFVTAAGAIARDCPDAYFVFVGDGPLRPQVEAEIAALGIGDRFILTGLRRDVPDLMAAFDVFVLTSLWEGLPRVLPQAMATGLPIVATAVDGNAEAVTDGVNGRLVPPGRPDRVAQAVLELLDSPDLMKSMASKGKERAKEFGARQMVDQIARLYDQLLAQKGVESQ